MDYVAAEPVANGKRVQVGSSVFQTGEPLSLTLIGAGTMEREYVFDPDAVCRDGDGRVACVLRGSVGGRESECDFECGERATGGDENGGGGFRTGGERDEWASGVG